MISIPTIPANWMEYSGILLAGNGMRTRVELVMHTVKGRFEYAIHTAYVGDSGEWEYENGRYYDTKLQAELSYDHLKTKL